MTQHDYSNGINGMQQACREYGFEEARRRLVEYLQAELERVADSNDYDIAKAIQKNTLNRTLEHVVGEMTP